MEKRNFKEGLLAFSESLKECDAKVYNLVKKENVTNYDRDYVKLLKRAHQFYFFLIMCIPDIESYSNEEYEDLCAGLFNVQLGIVAGAEFLTEDPLLWDNIAETHYDIDEIIRFLFETGKLPLFENDEFDPEDKSHSFVFRFSEENEEKEID